MMESYDHPEDPIGTGEYKVREGDCISSIAKRAGHFWGTVWHDPANEALRATRNMPTVLLPGDRVYIPKKRRGVEDGVTEQRHRFRRRGIPARLRLRLLQEGEPLADLPYLVDVDGCCREGRLDAEGRLDIDIPPDAQAGTLWIGEGPRRKAFPLRLGHLNPVDSVDGMQARLNGLGFYCGPADGDLGTRTQQSLQRYQKQHGLQETGQPDETTLRHLEQEYGS